MTILGKMLVFVNLVFSFLAFAWALALYTNRVDYTDNPAAEDRPAGELVARKAALKDMDATFRRSVAALRNARRDLAAAETGTAPEYQNGRPADRDWYEAELDLLATGSPKGAPVRQLHDLVTAGGQLKLDDKGRPVLVNAPSPDDKAPLRSLADMRTERKQVLEDTRKQQVKLLDLTQKDIQLTEDIIGTEDGSRKGLRRRLEDEKVKLADVYKEHERVQPLLINAAVDAQLILQRQDILMRRIEELRPKQPDAPR